MSYSNIFLKDFKPIFEAILKEKGIRPEKVELEVIDEEGEDFGVFEPADAKDVLEQLGDDLNFLTIYTERPAYFREFAETMYEENGLIVMIFPKKDFLSGIRHRTSRPDVHTVSVKDTLAQGRFSKKNSRKGNRRGFIQKLVLDFEWEGSSYEGQAGMGRHYIPIHKKPWEVADNLDITVPIGYNTVIVKSTQIIEKQPERDRFEAAFYET